jgi:uracil-DNA glycosylase
MTSNVAVPLHERVQLGPGWQEALESEFKQPYMLGLAEFIRKERASAVPIYPPPALVFNAFHQTPLESVRVVILGQDPYHGPGQAHGLCFSVPKGVSFPPSLRNIFQEVVADVATPPPPHGCLTEWARQGVFLPNTVLTVRQGQANSHAGQGWELFTDAVIIRLLGRGVIFLLWGRAARDKLQRLGPKEILLHAPHPSPLSAASGFFGCRHFSKTNQWLIRRGSSPIDWSLH